MSEELIIFSEQIDEQFDIADMQSVESDDLLEAIVNLFIWFASYLTVVISNDSERACAPMPADFAYSIRFLFRSNTHFHHAQSKWHRSKAATTRLQHSNLQHP